MRRKRPSPSGPFRASAFVPCAFAFVSLLGISTARAQNVAEAARQEQARKSSAQSPATSQERHVYTNEDLKRAKILTPRDRATIEARKKNSPAPDAKPSRTLDAANGASAKSPSASDNGSSNSLGEVARRYRAEKAAREQQAFAQKVQPRAPYRLNIPRTSHATPNPSMLPLLAPPNPLAPPNARPAAPYAAVRRDPFSRPRAGSVPRDFSAPVPPANLAPGKLSPASPLLPKKFFPLPPATEVRPQLASQPKLNAVAPVVSTGSLRPDELLAVGNAEPTAPKNLGSDFFAGAVALAQAGRTLSAASAVAPILRDSLSARLFLYRTTTRKPAVPFMKAPAPLPPAATSYQPGAPVLNAPVTALPRAFVPKPGTPEVTSANPMASLHSVPSAAPMNSSSISVHAGDSLWSLSRRYLGRGSRWQEWLAINPVLVAPNRLEPGMVLSIPSVTPLPSKASSLTVRKGDSLWKLAKRLFGHGSQWVCLAAANPTVRDANLLQPGQVLQLPVSCSPVDR